MTFLQMLYMAIFTAVVNLIVNLFILGREKKKRESELLFQNVQKMRVDLYLEFIQELNKKIENTNMDPEKIRAYLESKGVGFRFLASKNTYIEYMRTLRFLDHMEVRRPDALQVFFERLVNSIRKELTLDEINLDECEEELSSLILGFYSDENDNNYAKLGTRSEIDAWQRENLRPKNKTTHK